MFNATEADERTYLKRVLGLLQKAHDAIDARVRRYARDIQDQKTYLWENRAEMDHAEKNATRQSALQTLSSGEVAANERNQISKLLEIPYFGRIDFSKKDEASQPIHAYIGMHSFEHPTDKTSLIFDWRAPISNLFYDFELGPAQYPAPSGTVFGVLQLKRQYRIRNGKMEFMLESGLNILDDVLQEELSRTSDERMKTIVSTIQRDQNAIIRNEDAQTLIIQGVAGSGKTSIALHRIAYLLYRQKDHLRANNILIVSPNKVFSDFISNVLPELGEAPIQEIEMPELAAEILERKMKFQTVHEQNELLCSTPDKDFLTRIKTKASTDFLIQLNKYIQHVKNNRFIAADVKILKFQVPAWYVSHVFEKRRDLITSKRLQWVAQKVAHEFWVQYRYEVTKEDRAEIRRQIARMHPTQTLRSLYSDFFKWMGRPELFFPVSKTKLEYSDVFPFIYLKIHLENTPATYREIQHLVVDEMQDYTAIQYAVLSELFSCSKTILGDAYQSLNPYASSNAKDIESHFSHSETVSLHKSYRSSYEITEFANAILPNKNLLPIQRHGEAPVVHKCANATEESLLIRNEIERFQRHSFKTFAIVCKTQKEAEKLFKKLKVVVPFVHLLSPQSKTFFDGVTICSVHLSKGLEFDEVLIPYTTHTNYFTELERRLLYVACTRAMHRLTVSHTGTLTSFIPSEN